MPPIDDPKQLVDYLQSFLNLVHGGMGGQPYGAWTSRIRADLTALPDDSIRRRALELLGHVESGAYVLQRNPEMRESVVLPAIQKLIDYLKQAFGL